MSLGNQGSAARGRQTVNGRVQCAISLGHNREMDDIAEDGEIDLVGGQLSLVVAGIVRCGPKISLGPRDVGRPIADTSQRQKAAEGCCPRRRHDRKLVHRERGVESMFPGAPARIAPRLGFEIIFSS
jgi:hypothetical protein